MENRTNITKSQPEYLLKKKERIKEILGLSEMEYQKLLFDYGMRFALLTQEGVALAKSKEGGFWNYWVYVYLMSDSRLVNSDMYININTYRKEKELLIKRDHAYIHFTDYLKNKDNGNKKDRQSK